VTARRAVCVCDCGCDARVEEDGDVCLPCAVACRAQGQPADPG